MAAFIISLLGGVGAWMLTQKIPGASADANAQGTPRQQVSGQSRQGYRQGNAASVSTKKTEGARAIVGTQQKKITNDVAADLQQRMDSTSDPEWAMRWANAYHRTYTQQQVNDGTPPAQGTPVVNARVNPYVADDSGLASGWTRRFFTYHGRFQTVKPAPVNASPVMPARRLNQNDDADQTAIVTCLSGPAGPKSVIYPRDFSSIPVKTVNEMGKHGKSSYNYAKTPQAQPRKKIPMHAQIDRNNQGSIKGGSW
jgi:hypothetical protein